MSEASIGAYVALCSQRTVHEPGEDAYDRLCDRLDRAVLHSEVR